MRLGGSPFPLFAYDAAQGKDGLPHTRMTEVFSTLGRAFRRIGIGPTTFRLVVGGCGIRYPSFGIRCSCPWGRGVFHPL